MRRKTAARCSPTSSRRPSSTGRSCASSRAPILPPISASRPSRSPRPCASPPSATSAPTWPKFDVGDRQVPIRVQLDETARAATAQILEALKVRRPRAERAVPLSSVADVRDEPGPDHDRPLRPRSAASLIGADLVGDHAARRRARALIDDLPAAQEPAAGRRGQAVRRRRDHGRGVRRASPQAMGAGLMMVYAVLVLLFGSFLQPITILFSLPLSIGGAIVALRHHRQAAEPAGRRSAS